MNSRLTAEAQGINESTHSMLANYVEWGAKIGHADTQWAPYSEMIDFVNFRLETVETCVELIDRNKIAEALGLCRSLLENYLLFMLMCRGRKYFQLEDRTDLTESQFKVYLKEVQENFSAREVDDGDHRCAIEKYGRAKRHLMHISEGLKGSTEDGEAFFVPIHYFHFKEFQPDVMRLDAEEYFDYPVHATIIKNAVRKHKKEASSIYKMYLSYDALLTCLELNDLADRAAIRRIEAHYTFLGQFLHPTHDAARKLHESSNYYEGTPAIGMTAPYAPKARILASLYVCYLAAGFIEEIAALHENAPDKYIIDPGAAELRASIELIPNKYSYFWFIFNEAPLYDKYMHCTARASAEEFEEYGHYANTPSEAVLFEKDIYKHLCDALTDSRNARAGIYRSPLT